VRGTPFDARPGLKSAVMARISFRRIRIDTLSADEDGRLIILQNRLIGVLVRLESEEQGLLRGSWALEAGFGPLSSARPEPFVDLRSARDWARQILNPMPQRS
jgi:hypothetical protein